MKKVQLPQDTNHNRRAKWRSPGAHNQQRATPILVLCHGVSSSGPVNFWTHFRAFFSAKIEISTNGFERIRSIRYQEGKINVIKRKKISV